jgi:hypothetical protein
MDNAPLASLQVIFYKIIPKFRVCILKREYPINLDTITEIYLSLKFMILF